MCDLSVSVCDVGKVECLHPIVGFLAAVLCWECSTPLFVVLF